MANEAHLVKGLMGPLIIKIGIWIDCECTCVCHQAFFNVCDNVEVNKKFCVEFLTMEKLIPMVSRSK
jgi:hypothetical protein